MKVRSAVTYVTYIAISHLYAHGICVKTPRHEPRFRPMNIIVLIRHEWQSISCSSYLLAINCDIAHS